MKKLYQSALLTTLTSGLALSLTTGCGSSSNNQGFFNNPNGPNGPNVPVNNGRLRLELQYQNPAARIQGRISDAERSFRVQLLNPSTGADLIPPVTVQRQSGVTSQFVDLSSLPVGPAVVRITGFDNNGQAISRIDLSVNITDGGVVQLVAATLNPISPGEEEPELPISLTVERLNVSNAGVQSDVDDELGEQATVSADGRYVTFVSRATNLDPDFVEGIGSVYVRDRQSNTTKVLESPGNNPTISGDGNSVVYSNTDQQAHIKPRASGPSQFVSVNVGGQQGNGLSYSSDVSRDGGAVLFHSYASNLFEGDENETPDLFLRTLASNSTVRVNINPEGEPIYTRLRASLSGDAQVVAFETDGYVFARNLSAGTTSLVTQDRFGQTALDLRVQGVSLSANGRFVVFSADGIPQEEVPNPVVDLVEGDTNMALDIFVRDLQTSTTTRVSVSSSGEQANGESGLGSRESSSHSISGDGRFVVFSSAASNLVPNDTNGQRDIFLHDRQTRRTVRLSVGVNGAQANGRSDLPCISEDGRIVTFNSRASNLVAGDTNDCNDIFAVGNPLAP